VNPGGILLCVAGVWVLCQLLGGDALGRLGIYQPADAVPPTGGSSGGSGLGDGAGPGQGSGGGGGSSW
jgi:hypothetical protein